MLEVISHILTGIAIAIAASMLFVPNRSLGKKVAGISIGCAAIGLFFPVVGICIWIVVVVGLCISFAVSVLRGFRHLRW